VTDHALAFYGNRSHPLTNEEERRQLMRRLISWGLVALVHVLLLAMMALDQYHWHSMALRKPGTELILDISQAPRSAAPPVQLIEPIVPRASAPEVTTAPVIVVPPPPPNSQAPPLPQAPADILKAIGEALSCGAENFENLTQAERNRCKREPWIARKLPNGTIVLEAAAPSPFAPAPTVPKISGADALRHDMQTAPPCPIMVSNVPCMTVTPQLSIPLN
jgi:hypothetical protein